MIISSDGTVMLKGTSHDLQKDLIFAIRGMLDKNIINEHMLQNCIDIATMTEEELKDEYFRIIDDFDIEDFDDDDDDNDTFNNVFGDLF